MITLKRCKEIFSDSEKFHDIKKDDGQCGFYRVNMKNLAKDGYHYDFGFRLRPNGFNDVAEVFFGKWTPLVSKLVFVDICDEETLLRLIQLCHIEGCL